MSAHLFSFLSSISPLGWIRTISNPRFSYIYPKSTAEKPINPQFATANIGPNWTQIVGVSLLSSVAWLQLSLERAAWVTPNQCTVARRCRAKAAAGRQRLSWGRPNSRPRASIQTTSVQRAISTKTQISIARNCLVVTFRPASLSREYNLHRPLAESGLQAHPARQSQPYLVPTVFPLVRGQFTQRSSPPVIASAWEDRCTQFIAVSPTMARR